MCTLGDQVHGDQMPGGVMEALRILDAALDYINDPLTGELPASVHGEALAALGRVNAKLAAARAGLLSRFDATRGHDADGYGSSAAWLAAMNRVTRKAANADVRRMRQLRRHPVIADALARGEVSESWAAEMAEWTRRLPAELRGGVDKLLVDTAAAGANLEDLAVVARAAYEQWCSQQPDPDEGDDGFEDRYLKLGTTIDNAGRVTGDLTPECTAAVQAVLESLGKKRGPEDARSEPQRFHDALQEACELLIRADMVPDRAGADTRVDAVISLAELLALPGASELQEAWLAAMTGQHAHLAGKGAEAAACDALITPVVTGHPDLRVVDQMLDIILAFLDTETEDHREGGTGAADGGRNDARPGHVPQADAYDGDEADPPQSAAARGQDSAAAARTLPPAPPSRGASYDAWQALRHAIARLAVELVSGPDGLAATLRQGLLPHPHNSKPVILDVGYSDQIPGAIRRAVTLRARHCEWPGCRKRPATCDVHHLRHKADGGETSVQNCVLLCQFHHDICIHRWNWRLILHPDGTTTAHGPKGQVTHSHGPPSRDSQVTHSHGLPSGQVIPHGPPEGS
jgi:hypothetical protein